MLSTAASPIQSFLYPPFVRSGVGSDVGDRNVSSLEILSMVELDGLERFGIPPELCASSLVQALTGTGLVPAKLRNAPNLNRPEIHLAPEFTTGPDRSIPHALFHATPVTLKRLHRSMLSRQ